jgi:serine/threonine-protein kinase
MARQRPPTAPVANVTPSHTPVPAGSLLPAQPAYQPPGDPLIGKVIVDRYLVQKKLGEGGMGAVYLAVHTLLEKQVALKVLHGEFARKPDLVERFMQEAKAASRIRHENVIDISDFGVTPDGFVFFAMELLQGHDLHEEITRARLAGQCLPWARSRKIFLQICDALAAAHAQNIVHRDLKPENIYLIDFLGSKDFVKLLDFGIAKLTEVSEGDRKLTRTGMLFGTPEYMSPEQARGDSVDHRVDVYAMGCILYQLITGRVPFEAENFMGILSRHLMEAPAPIPDAMFSAIGASPELAGIVMKALAKDRMQRWQSISEMANAVRALAGEPPVAAHSAPRSDNSGVQASGHKRTQWTGSLRLDDDTAAVSHLRPRSRWPWLIAGVAVIGAGAATLQVMGQRGANPVAPAPAAPAVLPAVGVSVDAGAGSAPTVPTTATVPSVDGGLVDAAPPAPDARSKSSRDAGKNPRTPGPETIPDDSGEDTDRIELKKDFLPVGPGASKN